MRERVRNLLLEAKEANKRPDAYGLLPDIIKILEMLQGELESDSPDPESIVRGASALGRVVTDSYSFSESPLGGKLLDLITEIVSQYGSRFRKRGCPQ